MEHIFWDRIFCDDQGYLLWESLHIRSTQCLSLTVISLWKYNLYSKHLKDYTNKDASVQFSHSVVSDSLWPQELQHARPRCPSPTPGVHWNSCPLSSWCHPAISCSVVPFSSCPQSLPASESFPMSQYFTSGGQSIGAQLQHQSFQ